MPEIISSYDLAATYPQHGDLGPWARVQEYRRVQDYCGDHPEKGSHAVASALELPRSRIRSWVDGDAKPEPVKAIDQARELDWLNVDVDTDNGHAWTRLVAWIYAGGSISKTDFRPTFYARKDQRDGGLAKPEVDVIGQALQDVGVEYEFRDRGDVYDGGRQPIGERATEIVPTTRRSLLGRCLAAAGAPIGEKNRSHPEQLPEWLDESSPETQRVFARIYLLTRAAIRDRQPRFVIREERPDSYHEDLVDLFQRLAPDGVVTRSGHNVHVRSEVAEEIVDG